MKQFCYTREEIEDLMYQICQKSHISLTIYHTLEEAPQHELYRNIVTYSGDEIQVGVFDNLEYLLISFFTAFAELRLNALIPGKQIGYLSNNTSDIQYAIWCTMQGIAFAYLNYRIIFSDQAVSWMIEQAKTFNTEENNTVKQVYVDNDFYAIERSWSPEEEDKSYIQIRAISKTNFGKNGFQLRDWAHEKHYNYCSKGNEFLCFIPIDTNAYDIADSFMTLQHMLNVFDADAEISIHKTKTLPLDTVYMENVPFFGGK